MKRNLMEIFYFYVIFIFGVTGVLQIYSELI